MNIYDFAGNIEEWTLELTTLALNGNDCRGIYRGSGFKDGYYFYAIMRNTDDRASNWGGNTGLRVTIF